MVMAAAGEAAVIMAVGAAAVGVTVEDGEAAAGAVAAVGAAGGAVEDGAAMEATAAMAVTAAAMGAAGVGMDSGCGSVEDLQMSLRPLSQTTKAVSFCDTGLARQSSRVVRHAVTRSTFSPIDQLSSV